jgi:hypothetical protein
VGENLGDVPYSKRCQADVGSRIFRTHQFEPGFAVGRDSDGLDSLFPRNVVIEPEERLMRLDASSTVVLGNLERDSQNVLRTEQDR